MSQTDLIPLPHGREDGARPRWECPECGSTNVQIAKATWYRETANGLTLVDADTVSQPLFWYCDDCRSMDGRPIDRFAEGA
jgi:hypothetical protein